MPFPNLDLTRTGRLAEATALLRGLSRKEGSPEASQLIDMVPTRSGSSHWTAPGVDAQQQTVSALTEGLGQPYGPEALRGFLESHRMRGSSLGLGWIAGDLARDARTSWPEGARFEEHTYVNEAGSRRYKLFVPGCYCGEPLPLVVMLHGCKVTRRLRRRNANERIGGRATLSGRLSRATTRGKPLKMLELVQR